jgi:spermidine/putrescine transport system ATP-binding protein
MKELLRLDALTKSFGAVAAVNSVSMSVLDGEFLTVLGPSGSGKTTILRMIAGFEQPTAGRILLDGKDISDMPVNRRPFNTVFQDYALFPHMTVSDNIGYGLKVRHAARTEITDRVQEALGSVDLAGYGARYPDQLSGGQRQRVALARSLILRPRILLLDEPLGALDLALRKKMQITLKEIQEKVKITFIHVTHDQEEALSISDRIAIINLGDLQQVAEPRDVYFRPENLFVARFMGENNLIEGRLARRNGDQVSVETPLGEVRSRAAGLDDKFPAEGMVSLVVRPENIFMVEGDAPGDVNCLDAEVVREVFIGSEDKLIVRPQNHPGVEIMMKIHSGAGRDARAGQKIRIGWRAENGWLIPGAAPPRA